MNPVLEKIRIEIEEIEELIESGEDFDEEESESTLVEILDTIGHEMEMAKENDFEKLRKLQKKAKDLIQELNPGYEGTEWMMDPDGDDED